MCSINLQSDVDTVKVDGDEQKEVTVQISVEMPFDIRTIQCPTHKVKIKVRFTFGSKKWILVKIFGLRYTYSQ